MTIGIVRVAAMAADPYGIMGDDDIDAEPDELFSELWRDRFAPRYNETRP